MGGSDFHHGKIALLKRILSSSLFRFSLGFALSGLSIFLALRKVNISDLQRALSQSDWRFMCFALFSVAINVSMKVLRWKVLLGSSGKEAGCSKISMSFLAAQMLNSFLPVRAGEISRVYVMGRAGIGHAFVLGTIAVEKVMDLIAYSLLFVFLLFMMPLPKWIGASGTTIIVSVILLSAIVFLAAFYRNRLLALLDRLIARAPKRYQPFLFHHLRIGLASLDVLQDQAGRSWLAVSTAIIWGTAVFTNQLVFKSLDIELPATASLLLLIALQAGISIPSLPGKLGIFEYICILVLGLYGIEQALALSYGILLHIIVYLPIILTGILSYWLLEVSYREGKAASTGK